MESQVCVSDLSLGANPHVVNQRLVTPYLSLCDFPLHRFPFLLQVAEVLLRVAVWALGRHREQLVTLVQELLI